VSSIDAVRALKKGDKSQMDTGAKKEGMAEARQPSITQSRPRQPQKKEEAKTEKNCGCKKGRGEGEGGSALALSQEGRPGETSVKGKKTKRYIGHGKD